MLEETERPFNLRRGVVVARAGAFFRTRVISPVRSDYNLYLDPDGRFQLLQHDGNEVMNIPGGPGMPPV